MSQWHTRLELDLTIFSGALRFLIIYSTSDFKLNIHDPPLAPWRPGYVTSWIRHCHRSALDTRAGKAHPKHEMQQVDPFAIACFLFILSQLWRCLFCVCVLSILILIILWVLWLFLSGVRVKQMKCNLDGCKWMNITLGLTYLIGDKNNAYQNGSWMD